MLSMKSIKDDKKVNLSHVRVDDPELDYAISQNIKMDTSRTANKDKMGMLPVDIEDGVDDDIFDDLDDF